MGDVSRETVPVPDLAVVSQVFAPNRLGRLERYAGLLATEGVRRGLIGPREAPRLWDRHLVNCGLLSPLVPGGATVADLGSGAGLPGLVLALARPDLAVTLIEPMGRRVDFLREVTEQLEAENVEIMRARAEELSGEVRYDVVTARALAPLTRLVSWGLPLLAEDGALLAMKGSSAEEEIEAAASELALRRSRAEIVESSVPGASVMRVVRVVVQPGTTVGWRASSARRRRRERA